MKQTLSLFICLVFIAQSVFAAKDYDQSAKGNQKNLAEQARRQEIFKLEKRLLAEKLQKALGSTIVLDPSLGTSKEAQEKALNESIASSLYNNRAPKRSFKRNATTWSGRFASGNGGFMLGSQLLCAINAGASRDPMVWDACIDHFLSIEAWRDLAVFSVGSHMYSDSVRILRGVISNPTTRRVIYANAITKIMSETFMLSTANGLVNQGVGMTMGSMLQHFFIKYINSKETENRKINYTEWGYWFGEYTFTMRKITKLKTKLKTSKSLSSSEKSDLSGILQQLQLYADTAKERVEKHRNHWFVYFEESLKKFYTFEDEKEKQQFWIDTGIMVTSTAAVAMGHNLFNKAYSQAAYQISKHAVKDIPAFLKTMTDSEKQMVFSKYFNQIQNLEPKHQQKAISLVLEQRSKSKIKETLAGLILSKDSKLKLTDADRAYVQGPGPIMDKTGKFAGMMTEKQYASKVAGLSFKRKLYASMATGLHWTAAAALNAVVWLFTNETFMGWFKDVGYMGTVNWVYLPFMSQPINTTALSKAIKLYSLDDRIKDAKKTLLDAAAETIKPEIPLPVETLTKDQKEIEKRKILQKLVSYYQEHDELLLKINILNKAIEEKRSEYSQIREQALYYINDKNNPRPEMLKGLTAEQVNDKYYSELNELDAEVKEIASENQRDYQDSLQEAVELKRNALEKLNLLGFKLTSEQLDVEITKYKANPHVPDETDDYPDKYKAFLKALNEFHEVFRLYREETILREFQTHYMNYQAKLDKLQKEFYKKTRYIKWFLRGERLDDIDFIYNGSTDVSVVEKVIDDIHNNQESPLYGAEVGNKWHYDIYDELASFKEEREKIRSEVVKEIVKDIKWENSKRAIRGHDLSMKNIWTGQNIYNVLVKEEKKLTQEISSMQKTLLASLKKHVEKIIPAEQGDQQTKLQASYEREFIELQSVIAEIAKLAPKADFVTKLNQAFSSAHEPCDINKPTEISASGTRMFCQAFINASAPLTQRLKDFTPRYVKYVMDKENYRGIELRAEATALQIFNYVVQIKKTRDMLPKQREMIMALDLSSIGELNAENVLENKEIPATNKLRQLQEKNKPKDLGNEKF